MVIHHEVAEDSVSVDTAMLGILPLPALFALAEQSFSLKKRRRPFSSSSMSNSSFSSPECLSPRPPSKELPSVSRVFAEKTDPWTPLSCSLRKSPLAESAYDPKKQQSYFIQCFTTLGLLGRGSFGEVYKVKNNQDGRLCAVKRSLNRFKGDRDRDCKIREARNQERVCPHPHILNLVSAWEEAGRLYIQTELCHTSLLLHAASQTPGNDEYMAWSYLCDLLSALDHLHSRRFVHLDVKPANMLVTDSGRLKLGDFGLLLEFGESGSKKVREDDLGGDPRYMAPELFRGEYGPAADVFSLGVSILELACNIEVPNGGKGWQQLRHGRLPEVAKGLSADLQKVLQMMLTPETRERPTVPELLTLSSVRKRRWKRLAYLLLAETILTLTFYYKMVLCFGRRLFSSLYLPVFRTELAPCTPYKDGWEREATLFLRDTSEALAKEDSPRLVNLKITSSPLRISPLCGNRSPHLDPCDWSPPYEARGPSNVHSSDSSTHSTPTHTGYIRRLSRRKRSDDGLNQSGFGPKNLLCLFEDSVGEGQSFEIY
ncbi:membrane-associated tyrosine- and threonine-specific cdc2-inhibitory kinase-like [Corythoichthys intestinalis]|uniref:membrane-associated tyrosine- and threonine-specific cdc2-inhibitory kinase-like n=1 Tax=Corythoichthys intestinalis TaxID=161448 RepID=UPI0025A66700|nr:membrane-associated tyrosine- and threonine-specific cdc2-inhibitory kinase-like [Corythoichthys intestinalis]XP_061791842.1 membrane-associated tyrosine- and threonine-specific cdc2-inhibitory kinase-like [Nerophis lumbriciformis]